VNVATNEKLTIINAFVHDVATGTWIGSLVLLTILHGQVTRPEWGVAAALVPPLAAKFMWVTWTSLAVIMLTGVVRMVTFKVFGWTGDVARDRIRLLKVKHAVLGVAFAIGTAWQVFIAYR
jgi:putative copper export protein